MHADRPTMTTDLVNLRRSSTPVHTLRTLALAFPIGHLIEQGLTLIDLWIVGSVSTIVCGAACAR
jgi:hypothetical protein